MKTTETIRPDLTPIVLPPRPDPEKPILEHRFSRVELFNAAIENLDAVTDYQADRITDATLLAIIARHHGLEGTARLIEKYGRAE